MTRSVRFADDNQRSPNKPVAVNARRLFTGSGTSCQHFKPESLQEVNLDGCRSRKLFSKVTFIVLAKTHLEAETGAPNANQRDTFGRIVCPHICHQPTNTQTVDDSRWAK